VDEVSDVVFVDVEPPQEITDADAASNKHCNRCLMDPCFMMEEFIECLLIQISYHRGIVKSFGMSFYGDADKKNYSGK